MPTTISHERMGDSACVVTDDKPVQDLLATAARRPRGGCTRQNDRVYWVQSSALLAQVKALVAVLA